MPSSTPCRPTTEALLGPAGRAFAAFLRDRLPVVAAPAVPEIRLHQAAPRSGLRRWAEDTGTRAPPYWARPWGGGLVLARFLLDRPEEVAGRAVLDLGTGSGLVAIAAAMAGAAAVTAVDVDPHAVMAALINADLNGVTLTARQADLLGDEGPPPAIDTLLVGDLFYAPDLTARVAPFLKRCVAAGIRVLVGDPGRTDLPRRRLRPVFSCPMPDFGSGDAALRIATVSRFVGRDARADHGRPPRR